jgi:hypothetical protein
MLKGFEFGFRAVSRRLVLMYITETFLDIAEFTFTAEPRLIMKLKSGQGSLGILQEWRNERKKVLQPTVKLRPLGLDLE